MKHNQKLTPFAQNLRKNMTLEERILWYHYLKPHPAGFRRQYVIGNYIVDFYCPRAKLVIELDGSQHYEEKGQVYDEKRTKYLQSQGLIVVRIPNTEVKINLAGVCTYIDNILLTCNTQKV